MASSVANAGSGLMQRVESSMARAALLDNGYFSALEGGGMSRETFRATQRQFFHAVRFFSRPMAALMARIPDSATRQPLMHNLADEHGLSDEVEAGSPAFRPSLAHDRTFLAFLLTLDVSPETVRREPERSAVRAFNLGLLGACMGEPIETAFAALGIIEYAFADISALIGRAVVDRGWVRADDLVHYKLHAEIDKGHAAEFFQSVSAAWNADGAARENVVLGLELGLYLFGRLYEDLYAQAEAA